MTKKSAQELAEEYVKEMNYIDNLNRRLTGNAFLAGFAAGRDSGIEEAAKLFEDDTVQEFVTEYDTCDISERCKTILAENIRALRTKEK